MRKWAMFCMAVALCLTGCGSEGREPLDRLLEMEHNSIPSESVETLQKKEPRAKDIDYIQEEKKYTTCQSDFITFQKKFLKAIMQTKYRECFQRNIPELPDVRMGEEFENETEEYVAEEDWGVGRDAMLEETEEGETWEYDAQINGYCEDNVVLNLRQYVVSVIFEGQKAGILPKKICSTSVDYSEDDMGEKTAENEIDWDNYIYDELEHNTEGEYLLSDQYQPVKYKNCIFFLNKKKELVVEAFRVLLSKDEEFKTAMDRQGISWVYQMLEPYEKKIWDNPGVLKQPAMWEFYAKRGRTNGFTVYAGSDAFAMVKPNSQMIYKTLKWVDRYREGDAWDIADFTQEKDLALVQYHYAKGKIASEHNQSDKILEEEYDLYVFGSQKDKKIKEILFYNRGNQKEIPTEIKPTLLSYLKALGMKVSEAEGFLNKLPKEDGSLGKIVYQVEQDRERYRIYVPD